MNGLTPSEIEKSSFSPWNDDHQSIPPLNNPVESNQKTSKLAIKSPLSNSHGQEMNSLKIVHTGRNDKTTNK